VIQYNYTPLSAEEYVTIADAAVRAREKKQEDVASLLLERLELDLSIIGMVTTNSGDDNVCIRT
jgi:hypothetical protein